MRHRILLVLAACLALVCCKQKDRDYIEELNSISSKFMADIKSLYQDYTLANDEKGDKADTLYAHFCKKASAIVEEGLSAHQDDSVAVFIIYFINNYGIDDQAAILDRIGKLGPNAQSDKSVKEIKKCIENNLKAALGSQFIDFEAKDLAGKTVKLSKYAGRGKYCLVDFWASWCGPCKKEIATLKKIHAKYGKKIEMVSVAVWDEPQASKDTARAYRINWHQMVDAGSVPTDLYGIMGIPHVILLSPEGKILSRGFQGQALIKEVEARL